MITSYKELPIGACVRLYAANEIDDDVEKVAEILSIVTGQTPQEVLALPIAEFTDLQRRCAWVWDEPQPSEPRDTYTVGGRTCRLTRTIGAMTAAQFIDFQNCASNGGDIVDVLAVALVPDGYVYGNGYDYDEWKEVVARDVMTTDAVAILPFFVASLVRSCGLALRFSADILMKQARRKRDKAQTARARELHKAARSLIDGDGYRAWRRWLK